jgi:heme A synthase
MNVRFHRCVVFLALFGLAVILSGAYVTSTQVAAKEAQSEVSSAAGEEFHRGLSMALGALTLGAAIWSSFGRMRCQPLLWAAFTTLALSAALGWRVTPLPPGAAIFHSLLAHLFFATIVVAAVVTSPGWNRAAEIAQVIGWSSMRPLAVATPPVVFGQIVLGTAYRHNVTGVMPHIVGAMIVALMTVVVSAVILQNFPGPAPLRRAAGVLISIVLAQVCLGMAAFIMLVLNTAGTMAFVVATVGHVSIGAAALAASVVLAMQVLRAIPEKNST